MSSLFGGGKSKTTTVISLPPKSAAEQRLEELQLKLTERQLAEFEAAQEEEKGRRASPEFAAQQRLESLATEQLLARLEGRAPVLPAAAQERIGRTFELSKRRGTETLRQQLNEMAAARGLLPTDTPAAAPFAREERELLEGLETARAGAELDVGQTEALFAQQLQQFQQALRQQAFQNRLALATGQIGPGGSALLAGLGQQRMAAAPRTFLQTGQPGGLDMLGAGVGLLGGFGGLARGLGSLGWRPLGGGGGGGSAPTWT